jgi:putative ABC transport system permease protein
MLGLIIGTSSVILVMSVGAGAQSLITNQIERRGTDMIAVLPGAAEDTGPPASAFGVVVTTLTANDALAIGERSNVKNVTAVTAYIIGNDTMSYLSTEKNITYTGTMPSYVDVERITIASGRFFDEREAENRDRVIVLGSRLAEDIFGNEDPIGKSIKLKKKRFRVIGVMTQKGSTLFENPDDSALIPLETAQYDLLGVRHVSMIRMTVDDEHNIPIAVAEVKETLRERHDDDDFSVRNTADLLDILVTITNALRFFLVAVAAIALFVGGVGIMNIMMISVRNKTREVGLRKAVGATNRDIMEQFLGESFFLAAIGGVIGICLGTSVSYIIYRIVRSMGFDYSFIITFSSVFIAFTTCTAIGIIFGAYPARKAAKLDPIDALRYE